MMKWAVAAVIILLIGFTFNLGVMVYAMWALFGIMLITRWLTSRWTAAPKAVRVTSQGEAEVGNVVEVKIQIKNEGKVPIAWALIEDLLPPNAIHEKGTRLALEGERLCVKRLGPGKEIELDYNLTCLKRGYYQIGPLVFESGDVFGLFRKYRVLAEPHFLTVLPRTHYVEGYDIASRKPIGEIVMTHRLFEDPTRIAGVRQYQPGDSLSRIHWRATARTNELHSKVYEPSSMAGATIILDFHKDSYDIKHEPFRSELAVSAVASIANVIFEMNEQVGFVSNGRDAVDRIKDEGWRGDRRTRREAQKSIQMLGSSNRLEPVRVPTQKHPAQMDKIRKALARLELTDGMHFPRLIMESMSRLPRDASVIAVLSHVDMEMGVALGQLKRRGYAVTAIVNTSDHERFATLSAPLMAEGIETRMLIDEESIRTICSRQLLRA